MSRSQLQEGPATDHYHNTFGVDGETPSSGGLNLEIIGPFSVAFDTPEISTNGVLLTTLAPGTTVLRAWAEGAARWLGGTVSAANLQIWVGDQSEFSGCSVAEYAVGNNGSWQGGGESPFTEFQPLVKNVAGSDELYTQIARVTVESDLYVWVSLTGANPSQGAANIYALIVEVA